MDSLRPPRRSPDEGADQPARAPRWVTTIPIEYERRLYFLAILVLVGWYLLDRLL